jgi:hypothetical protein
MKKLVILLSLLFLIKASFGQKITYPEKASYISSDITAKDGRIYQYILYRIKHQEQHLDNQKYLKGVSSVSIIKDSIISPKLAVQSLKDIKKQYKEKSKLVNADYWGGEDESPVLEIYLSDTLWTKYWIECYKQDIK